MSIGNLIKLRILYVKINLHRYQSKFLILNSKLNDNQFTGPLPRTIGKLTRLEVLSVQNNNFYGPIPEIGNLTKLVELLLYYLTVYQEKYSFMYF